MSEADEASLQIRYVLLSLFNICQSKYNSKRVCDEHERVSDTDFEFLCVLKILSNKASKCLLRRDRDSETELNTWQVKFYVFSLDSMKAAVEIHLKWDYNFNNFNIRRNSSKLSIQNCSMPTFPLSRTVAGSNHHKFSTHCHWKRSRLLWEYFSYLSLLRRRIFRSMSLDSRLFYQFFFFSVSSSLALDWCMKICITLCERESSSRSTPESTLLFVVFCNLPNFPRRRSQKEKTIATVRRRRRRGRRIEKGNKISSGYWITMEKLS